MTQHSMEITGAVYDDVTGAVSLVLRANEFPLPRAVWKSTAGPTANDSP
jgi:hypothetical protein